MALARVLGRADLLLFSVSAILTIDTLASAASVGPAWFAWWGLVVVLFFIPYGLMIAELGSAWPAQGGLYVWVREALGARWASLAAWLYWINNAYWLPSVCIVFAATLLRMVPDGWIPAGLRQSPSSTWVQTSIALGVVWVTVAFGIVRLQVAKWVPNANAVVKLAIFGTLGALGLGSLLSGDSPANALDRSTLWPRWGEGLAFLPILVYNTLGFELMSGAGGEMRDPQRDVPRAVILTGALVTAVYAVGILGILVAVPLAELSVVSGTYDALVVLGTRSGDAGGILATGLGIAFLYGCLANVVTWSLGANRVAAVAAADGMLPAPLGHLHPVHGTPATAFLAMGTIGSVLLVGNAAMGSSPANLFWLMFKLAGICFLLSYLLVFPAFLVLRRRNPDQPRPYRMPGGDGAAAAAVVVCSSMIATACVLFFVPAPGAADPSRARWESVALAVQTLATIAAGWFLAPRTRGTDTHPQEDR